MRFGINKVWISKSTVHIFPSPSNTPQGERGRDVDEERSHLIIGVRHKRILPQHNGTQHRPVGKAKANGEESAPDVGGDNCLGKPQVKEDEDIGEVAEVQQEELKAKLVVGVAAV